ncbi:MAG: archaeal proteasome endopeptidase complex subunit beta [Nitrososphaerota archaeon]|nr:archaeal proteasome endopeptidase complex subunit beta [Nitrososphaerota archaeon]MDG6990308.1 archaeal proteasome endopeptidase complex subunit beta [Nitrososphaerota archaeon]
MYHGTTTVGLVCSDGVVLATDTRVTAGGFIAHKRGKKLLKIDENIAMTISGGVADAQNVVDTLKYYCNLYRMERNRPMPVKAAAQVVSNMLFSSRYYPYIADVLVGGVDKSGGSLFNVDIFGSLNQEKMIATGSGSPVAYGILEAEFKEGMPVAKAHQLAAKAIIAATKRNVATGDHFDVAILDKDGFRELSEAEKDKLLAQFTSNN